MLQLKVSITNEEPRKRMVRSAPNEAVIELVRQLPLNGKWGKVGAIPNQKRVASVQAAANYHGRRLSNGDWFVVTQSQKEDDGTYSVFIRKVTEEAQ